MSIQHVSNIAAAEPFKELALSQENPLCHARQTRANRWLMTLAEDELRKLNGLKGELAEHSKHAADWAEHLWTETLRDKAESLARTLHSKQPGPAAAGLRLTSQGTKLLIREFLAIQQMVRNRRDGLTGGDREEALNLIGVSFNCRLIEWDLVDPSPDEMFPQARVAIWTKFIDEEMAKLEATLVHLDRIEANQRARIMRGTPAPDDKVANRLKREIACRERNLRWCWTEARKLEKSKPTRNDDPAIESSDCEANPMSPGERDEPDLSRDCEPNPISLGKSEEATASTPDCEQKPNTEPPPEVVSVTIANCGTKPIEAPNSPLRIVRVQNCEAKPIPGRVSRTGRPVPVELGGISPSQLRARKLDLQGL